MYSTIRLPCRRNIFVAILILIASVTLVFKSDSAVGSPMLDIQQMTLVKNELRVVVETKVVVHPPDSHNAQVKNMLGYLLIIDLSSTNEIDKRTKIIGPIWQLPELHSAFAHEQLIPTSKADSDVLSKIARVHFDEDGKLVRERPGSSSNKFTTEHLDILSTSWKDPKTIDSIQTKESYFSNDRVTTRSGRYLLVYENGQSKLFDTDAGKEVPDEWLTSRFSESRRIDDFNNVTNFISDDLNHLVIRPYNAVRKDDQLIRTFDYDGKTYARSEYYLIASRAEPKLKVIKRTDEQLGRPYGAPDDILIVRNKLFLIRHSATEMNLFNESGRTEFLGTVKLPLNWKFANTRIHDESKGEIVYLSPSESKNHLPYHAVKICTWNYLKNDISVVEIPIESLFRIDGEGYVPAIKVIKPVGTQ